MKSYILTTPKPSQINRFPALLKKLESLPCGAHEALPVVSLGADLEKAEACLAAQVEGGTMLALATLTREESLDLTRELMARGVRVVVVLEACGFGWEWPRALRAAGATVFTVASEALSGRRKTNRRDAAALARLGTERVLHGNAQSGRVVREPSRAEQEPRAVARQRQKLISLRGRLEGMGRGLLLGFGMVEYPDGWWGKKMWFIAERWETTISLRKCVS